jgi:hypothetical protein
MPGLTSAGTGIDFTGTSRGGSVASSSPAPSEAATDPSTIAANAKVNLFGSISLLGNQSDARVFVNGCSRDIVSKRLGFVIPNPLFQYKSKRGVCYDPILEKYLN